MELVDQFKENYVKEKGKSNGLQEMSSRTEKEEKSADNPEEGEEFSDEGFSSPLVKK